MLHRPFVLRSVRKEILPEVAATVKWMMTVVIKLLYKAIKKDMVAVIQMLWLLFASL